MMTKNADRLLICGTNSGCGKTTVVCALLQALKNRNLDVVSFKCGPDYIDPMFHSEIIGVPSINIDLFFSGEDRAKDLFVNYAHELNIIEGVMGFYDGISMSSDEGSSYRTALALDSPALLVVNVRGMALSAAAIINGFTSLRTPNSVCGVILNGASDSTYPQLKDMIESECCVRVYGYLPRSDEYAVESRHLGLVTAQEIGDIRERLQKLAAQAEKSIDIDGLIELMHNQSTIEYEERRVPIQRDVRIAYAHDRAFCFYYQANLDILSQYGARLIPFSPLSDDSLPECDGLYIGGGYPELYAKQLSENTGMINSIKEAVTDGLPTIAECGGFMYLTQSIDGCRTVGILDTDCTDTGKLRRFGYVTLTAESDSMLFRSGETVRAHEFHYWDAAAPGTSMTAVKPNGRSWRCSYVSDTLYAGFPHLYLPSAPSCAERFVEKCIERRNRCETDGDRKKKL